MAHTPVVVQRIRGHPIPLPLVALSMKIRPNLCNIYNLDCIDL
jgi:hypothetical protein